MSTRRKNPSAERVRVAVGQDFFDPRSGVGFVIVALNPRGDEVYTQSTEGEEQRRSLSKLRTAIARGDVVEVNPQGGDSFRCWPAFQRSVPRETSKPTRERQLQT